MMNNILVTRSSMPEIEEYIEEIKDIWDTHWLTNMGIKHKRLQTELKDYLELIILIFYKWPYGIGVIFTGNELARRSYYQSIYICFYNTCDCA